MDTSRTAAEVARLLGTSVPRVHRAAAEGLIPVSHDARGRLRIDHAGVVALRARGGHAPQVEGLTREQAFVLAALGRRPFGLRSARAVARAAGVSPTTATRALSVLLAAGTVERRTDRVAEGRPRDVTVWTVRWSSPGWLAVAPTMGRVVVPTSKPPRPQCRVPRRFGHLFWNADLATLDVSEHGRYVADRILRGDDPQALAWMAEHVAPADVLAAARGRGLDAGSAAPGRLLARPAA